MKYHALVTVITTMALAASHGATTITYEDANLGSQGYINDSPYSAAGVTHANSFTDWGGGFTSWSGFAVSNKTDTTTAGYSNQYSVYAGAAAGGTQFAVGYYDGSSNPTGTRLTFSTPTAMAGMGAEFTNTTYAALDMLNGSSFSKVFGGASGNDPDFFLLTITGYLSGNSTNSTSLYLADYQSSDNADDYILSTWRYVDFSALGTVDEIRFTMSSSDNGMFGMNTPAYFAMDNLIVPEPSSITLGAFAGLFLLRRRRATR